MVIREADLPSFADSSCRGVPTPSAAMSDTVTCGGAGAGAASTAGGASTSTSDDAVPGFAGVRLVATAGAAVFLVGAPGAAVAAVAGELKRTSGIGGAGSIVLRPFALSLSVPVLAAPLATFP